MARLVAYLRFVADGMVLAAGSLPEISFTQLCYDLLTEVWQNCMSIPCLAPSAFAHLCTYYRSVQPFARAAVIFEAAIISHSNVAVAPVWMGIMALQWT